MLENDRPGTADVVKHIDRCLSCLSCMTTCPSGVNYMHLVDHARHHIEKTYRRPWFDRLYRSAARLRAAASNAVSLGDAGVDGGPAVRGPAAAGVARAAGADAEAPARGLGARPAAGGRQRDPAPPPRRAADRLRAESAGAGDQRSHGSPADATRLRGGDRRRGRLLRRAQSSPRPRRRAVRARQHLGVEPRDRARRPRRHRHQRLRLRHDGQGLRLHVPRRPRARRQGEARFGAHA